MWLKRRSACNWHCGTCTEARVQVSSVLEHRLTWTSIRHNHDFLGAHTHAHTLTYCCHQLAPASQNNAANVLQQRRNYIDFGQVEKRQGRRRKSKSKPHAKRIRFFFFLAVFTMRLALTSSSKKKERRKHNGQKFTWLDFRQFPTAAPPPSLCWPQLQALEGGAENFLNYCQNISAWLQCWPTLTCHIHQQHLLASSASFFRLPTFLPSHPSLCSVLFFLYSYVCVGLPFCPPHANVATKNVATKRKTTLQHFRRMPHDAR